MRTRKARIINDRVFLFCDLCHYHCPEEEIVLLVSGFNVCDACASVVSQAACYQLTKKIGIITKPPQKVYVLNDECIKSINSDCLQGVIADA